MVSDAQKRATARYNAAHYDRAEVKLPRGGKSALQNVAKNSDKSVNAFIVRAIRQTLQDDGIDPETIRTICGD